jgi:SAM-dependent methyltransferase
VTRINVGCGQTPTPGWTNYDNSPRAAAARIPFVTTLVDRLGLLTRQHRDFMRVALARDIRYADAVRRIPEPDHSVDVVYTSHMVEHLDLDEARQFLREARRVLIPGGVIRVAVPNVRYHVDRYIADGDADGLLARLYLTRSRPKTWREKAAYLLVGDRQHQWMYDGASLCRLLAQSGFEAPQVMPAGTTTIKDPGALDLAERSPESVFVEASSP